MAGNAFECDSPLLFQLDQYTNIAETDNTLLTFVYVEKYTVIHSHSHISPSSAARLSVCRLNIISNT